MNDATNHASGAGATPDRGAAAEARPRTKWRRDWAPMALALCVWLCTLPFVFLLVVPWLGARVAVVTALVLLGVIAVACRALCLGSRVGPDPSTRNAEP